ncbi:MAG TPA: VOC family protein [Candidatus Limnocylindrales bacterium]|nr:VOC family protein [Candidatus Limnocylindrales bacterium]
MLSDQQVYAAIPTDDIDRLRPFYEDVLGFVPREANPAGVYYDAAGGTYFVLTRSSGKASGSHTQMAFRVSDIESEVRDLQRRGVTFEEYETPRTVDGIATIPIGRTAWFRDPDGNLIGMIQFND